MIDTLEDYCNGNICDSCEFCNDCEKEMVFSEIVDEKLKDYVSRIDEKNTDKESQNECELEEKKMEQVKVLKKATKIYYPDEMKDVLPLKEFVKSITDKGYKVELTKDNVVSDTVVNIYKEVEMEE
nr:MAG TPA: Inhibitor of sigma-G Gin [Caudoviricetes sp.]